MSDECNVRVMRTGTTSPGSRPKPIVVHGEASAARQPRKGGRKSKYQCCKCKREFMSNICRPRCPFEDCGHYYCSRVHVGGHVGK